MLQGPALDGRQEVAAPVCGPFGASVLHRAPGCNGWRGKEHSRGQWPCNGEDEEEEEEEEEAEEEEEECLKLGLCQSDPSGAQEDAFDMEFPGIRGLLLPQQGKALSLPHSQTQGSLEEEWLWPIPLPTCWLCRSFLGKLESIIPKATIGKAMGQLCRILPVAIGGMCQCLMEKYTVTIVDMIVAKLGPQLLCGMLLMCATDENCGPEIPPAVAPVPLPVDRCQACLTISSKVKGAIQANSTQAKVEGALLAACSSTFLNWEECKSFIYQHQPKLFTLLPKPWDSQTICQATQYCQAHVWL
ncbi:hypothetical protein JD844_030887 [Phrynosoma platyrhinos]|uniref:Saposin B-type domain-containing protein n=1 Tax=Phrynosoma platyrhinos TaxID=52577 RepID=A0ABQ7T099_PHRPL|nr:hypothetical protein JD844_030887 [Phrynosoma platyrhinos]